jgi:hypothetical protein
MDKQIEVCVAAADPPVDGWPKRQASIYVHEKVPEFVNLGDASKFFQQEAEQLEKALYDTLPGSTYSELLKKMLERRTCHFRVSFGELWRGKR